MVNFVKLFQADRGIASELFEAEDGRKASFFATIGPAEVPGMMLSAHTDVVPVDGQNWSADPFRMRVSGGKAFGRGTTDTKGFLACALRIADRAARDHLTIPIHLAMSHDEEVGCLGVRNTQRHTASLRLH